MSGGAGWIEELRNEKRKREKDEWATSFYPGEGTEEKERARIK